MPVVVGQSRDGALVLEDEESEDGLRERGIERPRVDDNLVVARMELRRRVSYAVLLSRGAVELQHQTPLSLIAKAFTLTGFTAGAGRL